MATLRLGQAGNSVRLAAVLTPPPSLIEFGHSKRKLIYANKNKSMFSFAAAILSVNNFYDIPLLAYCLIYSLSVWPWGIKRHYVVEAFIYQMLRESIKREETNYSPQSITPCVYFHHLMGENCQKPDRLISNKEMDLQWLPSAFENMVWSCLSPATQDKSLKRKINKVTAQ